jgi:hypothetical protein
MTDLVFDCVDAQPDRYAAVPTLQLKLRISETTGAQVHAIGLRCQIRIEPQRRRYSPQEADGLLELFGEPPRWGDTLRVADGPRLHRQHRGRPARALHL